MTEQHDETGSSQAGSAMLVMGKRARECGFIAGESLVLPGWPVWSSTVAADLVPHLDSVMGKTARDCEDRLARRLAGAPVETVQLAVELLYVHLLIRNPGSIGRQSKEQWLEKIATASSEVVWFSEEQLQALECGSIAAGPNYNIHRDQQVAWLARVLQRRGQYSSEQWRRIVADPWAFRDFADAVTPSETTMYQRNALLYLLFPDTFEPIVSSPKQQRIVDVYGHEVTELSGDRDRDVRAVHEALAQRHGTFSFYDPEWQAHWDPAYPKTKRKTTSDRGRSRAAAEPEASSSSPETGLPRPSAALAEQLCVDHGWLVEVVASWERKRQIVFQGSPGTGKTYLARQLAESVTGTNGACRFVQFHPSYAYEDFVEGLRPQATPAGGGTVSFVLQPGPLKILAEQAREDPTGTYVLLIDELNRANLPAVFGELYFLLEYREQAVGLQYSPNVAFSLPSNLYVVATMNSADRSVAVVDAAMRRRFAWHTLSPELPPVRDMLRRWLRTHALPEESADLLERVNAQLPPGASPIGPSALMTPAVGTEQGLARIWHEELLPQLTDRHPGEDVATVNARYGLAVLRRQHPHHPESRHATDNVTVESGQDASVETGQPRCDV